MISDFRFAIFDCSILGRCLRPALGYLSSACRAGAWQSRVLRQAAVALCVGGCILVSGCVSGRNRSPASTRVVPQPVRVPAQVIANFFFVESTQADGQTYRFMVDTGSSVTYVSSPLANALKRKERRGTPPRTLPVRGVPCA
jgi:hypothetical protein